ncbi:MAG: hypothetical protein O3C57_06210, partial [Verrucomicrobia bacterium]|nr:hypothetical protein [Verrucomicrobiota bacterium]
FPEGCPAAETIAAIRQAGGIPVLPWSPGKWLGARARCVRDLIESQEPASLCLGDTAMRPAGFPEPAFFRIARRHGLACIAGTDPLPVPGEESILGSFASRWTAPEEDAPLSADAFKRLLLSHTSDPAGQRNAAFTSARRWLANARAK